MAVDYSGITKRLQNTFQDQFSTRMQHMLREADIFEATDGLWNLLGQHIQGRTEISQDKLLAHYAALLENQIYKALCLLCKEKKDCNTCRQRALGILHDFLQALPNIQTLLLTDIRAAYEGDPAAVDELETLLCYPGVRAITYQRMAHFLHQKGLRIVPRMMTERAHQLTGIDIHPGAEIGPSFFIDHGTGVVIGETCVIGAHVKLYQGVTLGAKSFPLDENGHPIKGIKRHPNIGDNVIIYAETTVLGNVTIGSGSVLGANKWITQDVPPNTYLN